MKPSFFRWLILSLVCLCVQCGPMELDRQASMIIDDAGLAPMVVSPVASGALDRSLPESILEQDRDGDGVPRRLDCDDTRNFIYPGAVDFCNGLDDDCNGIVDDSFGTGAPCDLMDGCGNRGTLQCGYDGWSVTCDNQDAVCP